MSDFLKDCYFNGFCKGRKNFVPTFAKKLRAMHHSAKSGLPAMPLNVKFKSKNFLVDSTLGGTAGS
jgi:hypothetical protein